MSILLVLNRHMNMQWKILESKDIWERFLSEHSSGELFQSWLWGEVQNKSGTNIYRFGLIEKGKLLGIAQIVIVKSRRGSFLHVRHGPVFATQNQMLWKEFFRNATAFGKSVGAQFIRISPLIIGSEKHHMIFSSFGLIYSPIHEVDAERCWVLDIDKSEEEILAGMRKSTRYEIRHAQKMGVTVQISNSKESVRNFLELYRETSERHGFVAHRLIQEEFEVFSREDKAIILSGYYKGDCIAGAIILFYAGQAIYHHGASLKSNAPVSHLVQWHAILEAKKRGIKLYNFYGIAPDNKPNHPWRGITVFKKGFGGREINYIHSYDYILSPLYFFGYIVELIRKCVLGY